MRRLWRSDGWSERGDLVVQAAVVAFFCVPLLSAGLAYLVGAFVETFGLRGGILEDIGIFFLFGAYSFLMSWAGLAALSPILVALHGRRWAGALPVILIAAPLGWIVRLVLTPVFGLADPYEAVDVILFGGFGAFYAAVLWLIWTFLASRTA